MKAKRLLEYPIITPDLDERIGTNINGPSLIRVPKWLPNPLGRYYLYFAHHQGQFIRLAYADNLTGPWQIYAPGTLQLDETPCRHHIGSPDVHIDNDNQRLVMYYHGPARNAEAAAQSVPTQRDLVWNNQRSFTATSRDGLHFKSRDEILGVSYFRVFPWDGNRYALGMPGIFYRSRDGLNNFEQGPVLFDRRMRHAALWLRGDVLHVFYTNAGDCPEQILHSSIELVDDWQKWQTSEPVPILSPEMDYEGGNLPLEPSARGAIHEPARQLRDPAVYVEDGRAFLLYCVAGERGIAVAELVE